MRAGIPFVVAALVTGGLAAGCASGTGSSTAASAGATGIPTSAGATTTAGSNPRSGGRATGSTSTATAPGDVGSPGLALAECMRANGVPNFPDPQPGGGMLFNPSGLNLAAPAFRAAQAKCRQFMVGGPAPPGSTTHPSAQTLAKLLGIAECMRRHGVPQFPDPRTSVPPDPFGSGYDFITDYDGAILLFPSALNRRSPAYTGAAAACGTLAEKLGSGPH